MYTTSSPNIRTVCILRFNPNGPYIYVHMVCTRYDTHDTRGSLRTAVCMFCTRTTHMVQQWITDTPLLCCCTAIRHPNEPRHPMQPPYKQSHHSTHVSRYLWQVDRMAHFLTQKRRKSGNQTINSTQLWCAHIKAQCE